MNLSNENQKILGERLSKLPPEYVESLKGGFVKNIIEYVRSNHELSDTKATTIENEVVLVLLAFEPLADLQGNVAAAAELEENEAEAISKDIRRAIPYYLEESLERVSEAQAAEETEVSTGSSTQEHTEVVEKEGIRLGPDASIRSEEATKEKGAPQPLTKEEVSSFLSPTRTMKDDIDELKEKPKEEKDAQSAQKKDATEDTKDVEQVASEEPSYIPRYSKPLTNSSDQNKKKDGNPQQ